MKQPFEENTEKWREQKGEGGTEGKQKGERQRKMVGIGRGLERKMKGETVTFTLLKGAICKYFFLTY